MADDPYSAFSTPVAAPNGGQSTDPYASFSTPVTQQQAPTPQQPSKWSNAPAAIAGMFNSTVDNGTLMQPARWVAEHLDVAGMMPKIKAKYPGQSDDFYQQKLHDVYGQGVTNLRQQDQAAVDNNPYPGHIIGNTITGAVASIPANPELLFVPGAGLEAGALKNGLRAAVPKVATVAGKNAVRFGAANAASDAAAQFMDMAEDQKKDFDVQRNLQAAGMGAVLGAGSSVVHATGASPLVQDAPIPDFVKNLFKERGVDTTPSNDPLARTSPLTGQRMNFSPEEQTQLRQLLKTGSVDDIKQFFQGKNGPQPTWAQVNQLVEMRDGGRGEMPVPENSRVPKAQQANYDQAIAEHEAQQRTQLVSDHVDATTADWKNKPDVEVINNVNDIQDPEVREAAIRDGVTHENTAGFVGKDGKVRLFANQMLSPDHVNATLFHEALGHYGLAQKFGAGLDKVLQSLLNRNVGQFSKRVDAWQKANPGAYGGNRIRAAEEVLARASEGGPMPKSWGDAVMSHIRQFGRQMGMKLQYSDAEIRHILSMAHDAVINGKPDVRSNGFKGAKVGPTDRKFDFGQPEPEQHEYPGEPTELDKPLNEPAQAAHPQGLDVSQLLGHEPGGIDMSNMFSHEQPGGLDIGPLLGRGEGGLDVSDALEHANGDTSHLLQFFPEYTENRYMRPSDFGVDENKPLPFTERDVIINRRLRGRLMHDGPVNPLDPSERAAMEDRIAREHGDAQDVMDTIGQAWRDGRTPHLAQSISVYDNRTGNNMGDFADRSEAFKYIDSHPDKEHLGIDRLGTNHRYMTAAELNNSIANGTYQVSRMEEAYNATDRDYVPVKRSNEEVIADARRAGWSPNQIKKQGDIPDLAKRVYQQQAAAKVLDNRMNEIAKRIGTPDETARDLDDARQAFVDHQYILKKIRGERAEMARAMNIMKMGYTRGQMESFGQLLRETGGPEGPLGDDTILRKLVERYKEVAGGKNPDGVNKLVDSIDKPHWEEYVGTFHHAMMLSGLSTHMKAPQDMMIGIGRDLMDSAGGLAFSAGREALRAIGVNVKPGIHPTEVAARLWGIMRAAMDAQTYAHTLQTFRDGGYNPQGFGGPGRARIPVVSKVMDLISAQDAFFRAFATNMHLYGLATRDAVNHARANKGAMDFDSIMTDGVNRAQAPSAGLLKEAKEAADQTLLLNKNKALKWMDTIKRNGAAPDSSAGDRALAFVTNFVAPFVRVEANSLWNRVVRRSPLAILDQQTLADLKAGGAKADTAMARVVLGTTSIVAGMTGLNKAYQKLTGKGPDNPQRKAILEATGWRPDAVHENGQYSTGNKLGVSLNPFDVHNQTSTMINDMVEQYKKGANAGQVMNGIALASISMFRSMADMSYLHDIAPSINALFAPEQTAPEKINQLIADQTATMEPNLFGQAARVGDQGQPMTVENGGNEWDNLKGTVKNTLMANVPGLREQLPKRIDPMGGEVQSGASFGGQHSYFPQNNRGIAGNHVDETNDPAKAEIGRLQRGSELNVIPSVQRTISIDGDKRKLSNEELSNFQRIVGRQLVESVREQMGTAEWAQMSDEEKVDWIREESKDIKSSVKEDLFGSD